MVAGPLRPLRLRPPSPAPRYQPPVPAAATPCPRVVPGIPGLSPHTSAPWPSSTLPPLGRPCFHPCARDMCARTSPSGVPEPPSSHRRMTSAPPPSAGKTRERWRVSWHDSHPRKARPGLLSMCLPPLARIFHPPMEWTESTADFRNREKEGTIGDDRRVSM